MCLLRIHYSIINTNNNVVYMPMCMCVCGYASRLYLQSKCAH